MEDDDLSPAERERMRRFDEWLRVSRGVLAKRAVPLVLAFCVLAALFAAALVRRTATSPFRYVAETRLLFSPRQAPKVQAMGDRQLLGILDRPSVKRAAGARLGLAPEAAARLEAALSLTQEKKPTNLFTVSAAAPSPEEAVARANAYAEALVAEYVDWRTHDLSSWDATLESRRAALQERIAAVEAEETAAKSATGVVSPVETLTLLNGLVSDQRRNRSRLGVEIANEEARRNRLEEEAGGRAAAVAAAAPRLRQCGEALAALDAEIARLREVYTDLNPRLQGKLEDRAALVADYLAMLRESGLEGVGPEDGGRIEEAARGLAESSARIEALEGSRRALDAEIADNEERIDALLAAVPVLERAKVALDGLGRNLLELEEQQRDLRHLAATSAGDLRQIEPATEAEDSNPVGPKNIAIALVGAGVATALLACLVLAWGLAFGKIIGAAELGAGGDMRVLGSIPRDGATEALGREAAHAAAAAFGADVEAAGVANASANCEEAVAALEMLGYSRSEASAAVGKLDSALPTETLIRQALRNLSKLS